MTLPTRVTIVEVGARDGLQNEPDVVPTAIKVAFIDRLAAAGLPVVEATSFVHPDWVPQLADAAEVLAGITPVDGIRYPVLVPNVRGLDRAVAAGAREVAVFAAASEAFSQRNLNRTIADSLTMFDPVVRQAKDSGLRVRAYVSTVLGCPYQGHVPHDDVLRVTESLLTMGAEEISLGDTIGVGSVGTVTALLAVCERTVGLDRLAVHFHDTYGQGLANTLTALEAGITVADTSAGGLGGCPYAPGAKGNLATEDLVYALWQSGVETGVDRGALVDTTAWMAAELGREPASRAAQALLAKRARGGEPDPFSC
jgi:hydroxymethylglutaryl-CoA lyase